ncbi:cd63 antigen [Borealophlyctis nickersoniae]|nr:cd63 antigen [Borealophlyctis nickersoniae]
MPLLSRITTFSFNRDTFWSAGGFMFVKNLLLLINFMSLLAGIILMGGGAYIKSSSSSSHSDIINLSGTIATSAIIIGIIITIVSFFGCFGAANEKGMLLKTYFALLLVLVILEISLGAAAYAKKDEVDGLLENAWRDAYVNHQNGTILSIQNTFQCCGYRNTTDYAIPDTCASDPSRQWTNRDPGPCRAIVQDTLKGSLNSIGGCGVAMGVIELIGLAFSVVLFRKIAQREQASESLLNEAWRINRNKIQYGYQNYQYI